MGVVTENQALSSPAPGRASGGDNLVEHVTTQNVPTQATRAIPQSPGHSELTVSDGKSGTI